MAERLLVLATPLVLLTGGWVIFYVLKEPPRSETCSEGTARGVDEYRGGLGTYATFAAAVIGALIGRISRTRRTLYALAICAWLALLYNAADDAFEIHVIAAWAVGFLGGEVALILSAVAALGGVWRRGALLTYLWLSLLVLVPLAVGVVASEGVAFLCLD